MKKTKAFTLTELLVVVVIIGVLSAIVLPKFSKVLETRKTTEAEAMLMAVRGEQEARCTLDKPYVQEAHKDQLASLPSNTGNNYTYTLTGSGVTASSQDKDYELSIKSYEDGRICCSGTYCASLNKKYPSCDELPADNSGCGVADIGTSTNPCAGGDCEPSPSCDENAKPATTQKCIPSGYTTECGEKTRSVTCDASTNYQWQAPQWSELSCQATSECVAACEEGAVDNGSPCGCGRQGRLQRTCSQGTWSDWVCMKGNELFTAKDVDEGGECGWRTTKYEECKGGPWDAGGSVIYVCSDDCTWKIQGTSCQHTEYVWAKGYAGSFSYMAGFPCHEGVSGQALGQFGGDVQACLKSYCDHYAYIPGIESQTMMEESAGLGSGALTGKCSGPVGSACSEGEQDTWCVGDFIEAVQGAGGGGSDLCKYNLLTCRPYTTHDNISNYQ